MAVKIRLPGTKISAVKEFTDRVEPRKAFWNRFKTLLEDGSTIINFYGAGGIGKSALLKKIKDDLKHRDKLVGDECKHITYDFSCGTNLQEILKTLKFQLAAYGCEFPFFDSGNYYYSLKIGQEITPLKAKSMMQKISWVKKINDKLWKADSAIYKTYPFLRVARGFLDVADEVFQATAVPRAITMCFTVVDSLLMYYMKKNEILDDAHTEVRNELNARKDEKNFLELYEYLPTLFAIDVADWLQKTGSKLVVILDNYESLTGATNALTTEQLKQSDLWLRGDDGLIFMIPNTLWTIAGRNELHWDGELADELEQHLISALSPEDSQRFLKRAGIADETLRGEIIKLTEGYPIFLDLCVDVYFRYKRKHSGEPSIAEFGKEREEVVKRICLYLDAAARDMLEFLCVLNVWTDEIAVEIGGAVLQNFSRNTYKRVKNFSFIQSRRVTNENFSLRIFRFDKTIQSLVISTCDKKLIADAQKAVDEYFNNLFAGKKIFDAQEIFYLKLWTEFIVRFAEDAEELSDRYQKFFSAHISTLTDNAQFHAAEEILNLFIGKLENFDAADTAAHICLEIDWGWLKRAQGKYSAAYEIANVACEKSTRLLGDAHPQTVAAMHKLAISLSDLGRYADAKNFREKVLAWRKKNLGDENPETIIAMNNLAASFNDLGRHTDAANLLEEVLTLSKKNLGEKNLDTVAAMNNLALSLNALGRYADAKILLEKVLSLYKKIFGDEHPNVIIAMLNLAISLSGLARHEDAVALQKKVLSLSKKVFGYEHPNTLIAMLNLANSMGDLARHDEALKRKRQLLTLSKKVFGDEHPNTVIIMNNLAVSLNDLGRYADAANLLERVLPLSKKIFGESHINTITAEKNLTTALDKLGGVR